MPRRDTAVTRLPKANNSKNKSSKKSRTGLLTRANTAFANRPRWQRVILYAALVVFGLLIIHNAVELSFKEVENPIYGISFSTKYAEELGLDWRETYIALLDDLQIRHLRLMSYWDDGETERGTYTLDDLDWQISQAHQRGATVSLSVGMRQPRWPECHKPPWYHDLSKQEQDQALFDYLTHVVLRYKDHPSLISYQLENEAVNTWFGECTDKDIDRQRLSEEFALIKRLDPNTPVWMSLSDQHGLPLGSLVPDKYGYSVYRTVYNDKTGPFKFYMTYPTPVWYHRLRAAWINNFKDRDIFIHELQLEPWGPVATVRLDIDEQNKSMDQAQIRTNVKFARKIGKQKIYTWGGEWWYWRKVHHNDPSIWETVRYELNRP